MKKLFKFILIGLSFTGFAHAQPKKDIVCDTVSLILNANNDSIKLYADWKKEASFPNPVKSDRAGYTDYKLTCPNISITQNKGVIEMKSKDYETLLSHFPDYRRKISLFDLSGYRYPNIQEDPYSFSVSINLENWEMKGAFLPVKEGDELSVLDMPTSGVVGYRVDGGELKPLIHNLKVHSYKSDFEQAKKIEIYVKAESKVGEAKTPVEALIIDKSNGSIKILNKHKFPSN
ncbi:hypothetical protein [Moraxella catarrhalis]|uniref:hypothetical protein n=1 Tax=Moraxella catarrhalis TaxID=480 RepID=UPI0004E82994|nr:hypothetical protein [Moraxella catarrhalis]AIK00679.1 hypothetical protein DR90_928 [Moraxella catarrhalis]AIT43376.1 hypothetical protein MC25239_00955 [Moraxella catarrhalis]ARB67756.1 hypothetical protein A6J52_07405 [Moraxella catarrhalis]AVL49631.1 hypothetical protein CEP83_00665 [Moraxella catarrhalis]KZR94062.1 hypothetical protein A4U55_07375 [Moraxella catarrhalis]